MEKNPEITQIMMQALLQTSDVFFLTDIKGNIVYVNPAFEQLTGYSLAEAVGKNASILKSGEQPTAFYRDMWAALKAGKTWSGRLVNRRKDGSTYVELQYISPIKDPAGNLKYFMASRRDITREIELEKQLNQSQKMESLGLLAGQISHDFNNLLTVIIGSMELIMEDLQESSVGRRLSTEILRSSRESAAMIRNLMMFARSHESRPVKIPLNEPVLQVKVLLGSLLGKTVSAEYRLTENPAMVRIEPEHFKQAVMNLAANARDAMNGKGRIFIKTYTAGPDGLPAGLSAGTYGVFEFADDGPGIPKEALPRIFEPFFTTKPKGKGTGLGLSTVYGMVSQNGGHIVAGNLPEGGAVFTIYFPAVE